MDSNVKAGDQTIVQCGASAGEVRQNLGPGKLQKGYRPKGRGAISLGREHTGTTVIYDSAGLRFARCVFGEPASHYRAYFAR